MVNIECHYPESIEAAIEILKIELPRRTLDFIKLTDEDKLGLFHYGIGNTIRIILGLSEGENLKLMDDCGSNDCLESFSFVLWMLWKDLNKQY